MPETPPEHPFWFACPTSHHSDVLLHKADWAASQDTVLQNTPPGFGHAQLIVDGGDGHLALRPPTMRSLGEEARRTQRNLTSTHRGHTPTETPEEFLLGLGVTDRLLGGKGGYRTRFCAKFAPTHCDLLVYAVQQRLRDLVWVCFTATHPSPTSVICHMYFVTDKIFSLVLLSVKYAYGPCFPPHPWSQPALLSPVPSTLPEQHNRYEELYSTYEESYPLHPVTAAPPLPHPERNSVGFAVLRTT